MKFIENIKKELNDNPELPFIIIIKIGFKIIFLVFLYELLLLFVYPFYIFLLLKLTK